MTYNHDYHKSYYQRNKEKILQQQKDRSLADPEKRRIAQKKYRDKYLSNPEAKQLAALNCLKWKSTLKGYLSRKITHLKKAKRSRILEVDIDVNFLLELWEKQNGRCAVSFYPMQYGEASLFAVSIDRIDSAGGYTKNNVQLLCQAINFAKNMYTNQEMIDFWNYRLTLNPGHNL